MNINEAIYTLKDAGFAIYLSDGRIPVLRRGDSSLQIIGGREIYIDEEGVKFIESNTFWIYQINGYWIVDFLVGQAVIILHVGLALADVVNIPIWAIKVIEKIEDSGQDGSIFWRVVLYLQVAHIATGMSREDDIALYFCDDFSEDIYNFMLSQKISTTNEPSAKLRFTGKAWELVVDEKTSGSFALDAVDEIVSRVKQLREDTEI